MPTLALILAWLLALAGVVAWPYVTGSATLGDDLTRRTVWVALAFYAAATWQMLGLLPADWRALTDRGRLTRWCWTLAWAAFVIHVGVAFHFYHDWSHTDAFDHVRDRSGVGEGVFASYLFTAVWTTDVTWWWLRPDAYARRPRWIDQLLHSFMAFIIVMATVVYEAGAIRWAGLSLCAGLALRIWRVRTSRVG
jgi:hypothetical protein